MEVFNNLFDLDLFKNFNFLALMVSDLSVCFAWQGWIIYLIPHPEEKGLTPYQSSGLAIAGGVGFFIDTGYVTDYQARTASFLLSGATFLTDPWINSFTGQMFLSTICTAAIGVGYTTSMAVAIKVNVRNIAQVVSFSLFVSSIGKYIGGILTG